VRILILNRWDDDFAEYNRYIDHGEHQVGYLTCSGGLYRLPCDHAVAVKVVENFEDPVALQTAALEVEGMLGGIDRLFALSEFDILHGARLRDTLDIPGLRSEQALLYRDKVAMKSAIRAAGLLTPAYTDCIDAGHLAQFAADIGVPLILKPRRGAASEGVVRVDNAYSLAMACSTLQDGVYECEQYVPGQIYHVDGIVSGSVLRFIQASRYLNTCLDFRNGLPLGSVLLDSDDPRREKLLRFAKQCLAALSLHTGAFHLEVIEALNGALYFLEIGARAGGGEIPFLVQELFHVDLVGEWINSELHACLRQPIAIPEASGGFLMVPEPLNAPCEVLSATSLLGVIPCLYWESVPVPGDILDGNGGYSHIGGRFRFKGSNAQQVEAAIRHAMEVFSLEVCPRLAVAA
jgi:hypothetical protein